MENWKKIKGFENYSVSDLGRVRRDEKGYGTYIGKILKQSLSQGYPSVSLYNGKLKSIRVHRLVAIAFIEKNENVNEVNHINGIKTDNRKENLEWISGLENIRHAHRSGLVNPFRESNIHHNAKLTDLQVLEMVDLRKQGWTLKKISQKFQVSSVCIGDIFKGKTWKHLTKINAQPV